MLLSNKVRNHKIKQTRNFSSITQTLNDLCQFVFQHVIHRAVHILTSIIHKNLIRQLHLLLFYTCYCCCNIFLPMQCISWQYNRSMSITFPLTTPPPYFLLRFRLKKIIKNIKHTVYMSRTSHFKVA